MRIRATVHLGRILVRACAEGVLIGARDAEAVGESVGAVPHHLSREHVRNGGRLGGEVRELEALEDGLELAHRRLDLLREDELLTDRPPGAGERRALGDPHGDLVLTPTLPTRSGPGAARCECVAQPGAWRAGEPQRAR